MSKDNPTMTDQTIRWDEAIEIRLNGEWYPVQHVGPAMRDGYRIVFFDAYGDGLSSTVVSAATGEGVGSRRVRNVRPATPKAHCTNGDPLDPARPCEGVELFTPNNLTAVAKIDGEWEEPGRHDPVFMRRVTAGDRLPVPAESWESRRDRVRRKRAEKDAAAKVDETIKRLRHAIAAKRDETIRTAITMLDGATRLHRWCQPDATLHVWPVGEVRLANLSTEAH